jgi:hypothetical protein
LSYISGVRCIRALGPNTVVSLASWGNAASLTRFFTALPPPCHAELPLVPEEPTPTSSYRFIRMGLDFNISVSPQPYACCNLAQFSYQWVWCGPVASFVGQVESGYAVLKPDYRVQ